MSHKRVWYVVALAILFTAYFVTARLGLALDAVSGFATLVWAPSGIALAALLLLGYRFWPAITLAAFLVNFVTGAPPLVAAGIAVGNTLEPLLGAYCLKRLVRFEPSMERIMDVLGLVLLAAVLSTTLSASIGVSSLWLGGTVTSAAYGATWVAWWIGDMLGALVAAPLILVWSQRTRLKLDRKQAMELVVCLGLLVGMSALVFRGVPPWGIKPFTFAYLIFPLFIWMALRFGQVGSVSATFVSSLVAIWGTITSLHAAGSTLSHRLLLLQSFMGVAAVTFMTMAAIVAERERTQRQEQRLAQRTASLTRQRLRLLALNRIKDDFISLTSHQLRTPATSVKQYTGMLLDHYAGKLTKRQRELLQMAYDNNEHQLQTIDMLLRVAQIDAGTIALKKEPVDLRLLVREIIKAQAANFAAKEQVVSVEPGQHRFVATVDKAKIRMVLENIIDNASKYSPPGKQLDIRLSQDSKQVSIAIEDQGVGMVKEDLRKLFKKFSRIDNALLDTVGGIGLGLYWAKKIVALHKGSITVTSAPNQGSTFTVTLPVGRTTSARVRRPAAVN